MVIRVGRGRTLGQKKQRPHSLTGAGVHFLFFLFYLPLLTPAHLTGSSQVPRVVLTSAHFLVLSLRAPNTHTHTHTNTITTGTLTDNLLKNCMCVFLLFSPNMGWKEEKWIGPMIGVETRPDAPLPHVQPFRTVGTITRLFYFYTLLWLVSP